MRRTDGRCTRATPAFFFLVLLVLAISFAFLVAPLVRIRVMLQVLVSAVERLRRISASFWITASSLILIHSRKLLASHWAHHPFTQAYLAIISYLTLLWLTKGFRTNITILNFFVVGATVGISLARWGPLLNGAVGLRLPRVARSLR